ncbi:hypothetical protein FS749_009872 [Ceratobasidium sp. UAMH 11750]|nr:hypothetical protein FS749_009872 [Ceratobasidium sp. UAMH 11750]
MGLGNMNNQGDKPTEGNHPTEATEPIPSRYIMVSLERTASGPNRNQYVNRPDCILPINETQIPVCLGADGMRMNDIRDKDQLFNTMKCIGLLRDILQNEIVDLKGWELIGWSSELDETKDIFVYAVVVKLWGKRPSEPLFKARLKA